MRLVKASEFARSLGINRSTMKSWYRAKPELFVKKKDGRYYIKLDLLAACQGLDLVSALMLPHAKWIKAAHLARIRNIPLRTMARWCRNHRHFAKRIGFVWYIDLEEYGLDLAQIDEILKELKPRGVGIPSRTQAQ